MTHNFEKIPSDYVLDFYLKKKKKIKLHTLFDHFLGEDKTFLKQPFLIFVKISL